MLNRDFLEDYERREDDKFRRFLKKFKNGEISIKEKYPQELKIVEPEVVKEEN